jgi:hypothetical protein
LLPDWATATGYQRTRATRRPSDRVIRARTGDPHVGKEMRALIALSFFVRTDQIGSFRSIVGDAKGARNFFARPPLAKQNISYERTLPSVSKKNRNSRKNNDLPSSDRQMAV